MPLAGEFADLHLEDGRRSEPKDEEAGSGQQQALGLEGGGWQERERPLSGFSKMERQRKGERSQGRG